jgi:hypothetical protein
MGMEVKILIKGLGEMMGELDTGCWISWIG